MSAAQEQLILNILANTTQAERGIGSLSKTIKGADEDVTGLALRLDDLGKKNAQARVGLKGNTEAQAQLDKLDVKMIAVGKRVMNPDITVEGVAKASLELGAISAQIDKVAKSGEKAAAPGGGLAALAGTGGGGAPTGMAALIGAGVALSPVLITLGTGLTGFAAAAYGAAAPILKASSASGGLSANLGKLTPAQRQAGESLIGLQQAYHAFSKSLQPEVIGVFNQGLKLARNLMQDVRPVAAATGKALGGFLGQVDREFQSGTWQKFFGFMAATAAPDMRLLGNVFTGLLNDLPPLIEGLQPLSVAILKASGSLTVMIGNLEKGNTGLESFLKFTGQVGTTGIPQVTHSSGLLGGALHAVADAGKVGSTALRDWVFGSTQAATAASTAAGKVGALSQAQQALVKSEVAAQQAFEAAHPTFIKSIGDSRDLSNNAAAAGRSLFQMALQQKGASGTSRDLSNNVAAAATAAYHMKLQQEGASGATRDLSNNAVAAAKNSDVFAGKVKNLSDAAQLAAPNLQHVYQQVTNLHNAEQKSLSTLTAYNDALIAQYDSAATLNQNLKTSHDRIGLNTQAQRNSFGAADTYINNTITAAKQAGNNSGEIDKVITSLKNELPKLESVKGGTQQYWQEVRTLVGWLHTLERERAIHEQITVTGKGQWAISGPSGSRGLQNQFPGPRAAAGAYISTGTTGTADNVIARVSKGELIVPSQMVRAGAVDHLRGAIPGFASGGVVGSYAGSVPGIPGFVNRENRATVNAIAASVASAVHSALTSAAAAARAFGTGGMGVSATGPLESYARGLLGAYGWSSQWPAFADIVARESGWNVHATNPTSGAYGIPQALPPGKMASAGPDWQTSGYTQLRWMMGYIKSRWGNPNAADANERSQHWYGSGFHGWANGPTLFGAGERGRERVDITPGGQAQKIVFEFRAGAGDAMTRAVIAAVQNYVTVHGGDAQVALGQRT